MAEMRKFKMIRSWDPSGVSGTGTVAEGAEFHDGQVVMSWFGRVHSIEIFPEIRGLIAIHGHSGATTVLFEDGEIVGLG